MLRNVNLERFIEFFNGRLKFVIFLIGVFIQYIKEYWGFLIFLNINILLFLYSKSLQRKGIQGFFILFGINIEL